jgi:dipeptidyl aminopeptidase/acylaminoacyl peptidase
MRPSALLRACLLALVLPAGSVAADGKRPMNVDDLFRFRRVSDPQLSPDGKAVAYVVATVDLPGNKSSSSIWLAPTAGRDKPRQLTNTTKKDRHPRWSPDGQRILFESNRSGADQLWVIDVGGGEARQLTTISSEAGNALWSPDGKQIAFVSAVYPEYSDKPFKESDALNKKRTEEVEKSPVKAKVFTKLFYRHWDSYVLDKRQHLFVMPFHDGPSHNGGGEPKDVTPGDRDAFPTSDTFSTGDNFTFSPDGSHLVYTATPERDEAWSTNYDICRVPVAGGKVEVLTQDNQAADSGPVFSPDGKHLAYRAQKRAGFEADRWQLMVVETDPGGAFKGRPRSLTADFDGSPDSFAWCPEGAAALAFTAEQNGYAPIYSTRHGKVSKISGDSTNLALTGSRNPKDPVLAYLRVALNQPAEVFIGSAATAKADGGPHLSEQNVSRANDKLLAELDLPRPESVTVKGDGGTPMQMWVLKPPGFDPKKKWPLAYLVHGGPQGAWEDGWSYRWNPELWAAQGYVVALPNPRGSTGFGQKYVDEISGDWGGKCFRDLMKGVDYLEKLPYIDKDRMAAAGASFGGYMMNWFQGNTARFRTLITHCGVYNFESMYALTDELWFDEWEHGGPPWGPNRASYEMHSPHRLAKNFKTPMLIIHNDLDFRVPVAEGHQLFTTLQRLKVPSRFINFPDEGHWVLKPKNSEYWHQEVFAWLKKYVPPGGR